MIRSSFSIMFYIKRTKPLKNQEVPIYIRITVDGGRAEISVKRSVIPKLWNQRKGNVESFAPHGNETNQYLEQVRYLIYKYHKELLDKNLPVTAQSIKKAYLNQNPEANMAILKVYQEHNENLKLLIGRGIAEGTYERHVTSRKHLESFIQEAYGRKDFGFNEVNHAFLVKYEAFLRTSRNCCNNTSIKYIKNFGKIIRYALCNDWIRVNPFRNLKYRLDEVDKPFLTQPELIKLINKCIPITRTAQVRDIFVFCCFTGLAFIDVKSLSQKDIEYGNDGTIWIRKQRHKSKQWAHIPLLPIARQIIEKYSLQHDCVRKGVLLPVLSNQKMNSYLKEVGDLCEIRKNLTTHCARHTFATTVTLANKISMESVSKMLGHSSLYDKEIRKDPGFDHRPGDEPTCRQASIPFKLM